MKKEELKNYLIILFVVVELLSMIFNFYFVNIEVNGTIYPLNFSIVFFCIGFFIVDIVADKFSPSEANKFIYYKIFSQIIFLILGNMSTWVYGLDNTQLSEILHKSPWGIVSGLLASYAGFYAMNSIMHSLKIRAYQGMSIFRRYLFSTVPGELLFSLIFTILCFYSYSSFEQLISIFIASSFTKITLSIIFASLVSVFARVNFIGKNIKAKRLKAQIYKTL